MTHIHYDPYDFEIDDDPHPIWRRMREEAPLYRNERYDFWVLSRFDDVEAGLVDWQVDHDKAKRAHTSTVRGWEQLPVLVRQ